MSDFQNSKLIAGYITKLEEEDFKKLAKFLRSPYHNSRQILVPFFEIIQQRSPDFGHKNFTKKKIYQKLYPGQAYHERIFQGLSGDLIKMIVAYLAHEELKKDEALEEALSNKGFASRNAYIKFRDTSEAVIKKLKHKENKSLQDFKNLLNVAHGLFFHPETPRDNKWADDHIITCMDALDSFYAYSKVTYGIELLTRNSFQDKKYEIKLLDEAMQLGKQTTLHENVLFILYTLAIAFLKSQNKKTYSHLKNYLFNQQDKIPKEGQMFASTILANYCSQQYTRGKHTYLPELVALHQLRDKQDLFLVNNRIHHNSFINVIVATAKYGDFDWTEYFKHKYTQHIKVDLQEDVLCLCRAYIHFHKGKFLDALAELKDIEHKPLYMNLRFRSLSIRAYYELSIKHNDEDYKEETEKNIQRLIPFLKHKNLTEDRKLRYKNFSLICLDLVYDRKEKALKKLKRTKEVMFRNWLMEKAEELTGFGNV